MRKIIVFICVIWLAWLAFSFVDVVSDNSHPNPEHSNVNAFSVLVD